MIKLNSLIRQVRESPNCQLLYSWALGPLLSKIRVIWTRALPYWDSLSDNWTGATKWLMGRCSGQRDDSRVQPYGAGWAQISSCYSERHATENVWIVNVWNFSFNIFRLWLTMGNNPWKAKPQVRRDCYVPELLTGPCLFPVVSWGYYNGSNMIWSDSVFSKFHFGNIFLLQSRDLGYNEFHIHYGGSCLQHTRG